MLGSKCNLKRHVRNLGYPLPLQIGGPKTTFLRRLCNLMATLTAYIFGMKHDIDDRSSALTTTRGLLHRLETTWTLVHKRLQTRPPFYLPYVNFAFYLIVRLRRRRSANRTQPNFAKRRIINRANDLLQNSWGRPPRKNGGQETFAFVRFFEFDT